METNYTSEMTMLITVSSSVQAAPTQHHLSPPPTLPKPGKDNLRLQRLLKKAARKNAALAPEQAKSFRSSLSPVNEASPDQEHDESTPPVETPETTAPTSTSLPTHLSIKPITQRVSSPFRRGKPFTLKVTEQRRIAEHVMLATSPAMPLLHKPVAPENLQQPEGTDLLSPHNPSIYIFPQHSPSSPASKEMAPDVTYVTKAHTYFHSVKPPRAKTPTASEAPGTVSQEDERPPSLVPETSSSEPCPGQIPTPINDSRATDPPPEPPLLSAAEAEPPNQDPRPVPTEEPMKDPSEPIPSDTHTDKPVEHGNNTEVSASETTTELLKQDGDILKSSTPSAPWRKAHPVTAAPAQTDSTGATTTDPGAEHVIQPSLTPSLPNTSPALKDESTLSSAEAKPAGAGASGWRRLRKHLMLQSEAPNFPEPNAEKLGQEKRSKEEKDSSQAIVSQDAKLFKSKAMRMWDAILYQVTVSKERKQQAEEKKPQKEESCFRPRRLPILLHKPRFDARKLKELAAKPMTKITTVFDASWFRPEAAEKHPKSFNRTASGWSVN